MSLTADYDWALTSLWHAHAGGAWRWTGSQYGWAVEMPAYSLVDLNANVSKGPLTLRTFVRNLTDSHGSRHSNNIYIDPTTMIAHFDTYIVQPRTIGIGVVYAF
jgi:hypothetical protein